jgi:hypothetical protein
MKDEGRRMKKQLDGRNRAKACLLCVIRLLLSSFLLPPSSFSLAFGQPDFKVVPSAEATPEGGIVNILMIQTEKERFELQIPKEYGTQIRQNDQSIVFTSLTGSSVITVKMTTNYAGALPKMESLRDQVAKKFAAASLVQTSPCVTSCGTGLLFDLFQPLPGNLTMRMRDGYVAFAEGSFEFTLSCDLREYDKHRLAFAWLLNSFRLQAEPVKKEP